MPKSVVAAAAGAAVLLAASAAGSQTVPGPYGPPVGLDQARAAVAAAEAEAKRQGFTMAFAVVDPSGDLVAFARMDGVQTGSITVAQDKARSAALYRRPSKAFAEAVAAGKLGVLGLHGAVAVEGGVPLVSGGKVIGALGVSGGSSEQDGQVAAVGVAAVR
jgi:uncharacterized protein GlcG (DUF336 family)